MQCYLNEEEIVTGNCKILRNCIDVLSKLCGVFRFKSLNDFEINTCPNLAPIDLSQIQYMRKHLSSNKAITYDGFTEQWLLKT